MEDKTRNTHSLSMENREFLNVTGITDVISFDEEIVVTETNDGILVIRGFDLHISTLNLDAGYLNIDGTISAITYEDTPIQKNSSFFKQIFK